MNPLIYQAREIMEKKFGFREFRDRQEEILEAIFSKEDVLIVMPTGAGKSLCYQLPAFIWPGLCLVISPLVALMKDQVDSLVMRGLPAGCLHSLMSSKEQEEFLKRLSQGEYKIIYAAPERLRQGAFLQQLKKQVISLVAVDEAHCISEWGHDFRPDYLRIRQALEYLGRPQTLALTATATARVREDIKHYLGLRSPRQFLTGFDRQNLFWEVIQVQKAEEKLAILVQRLENLRGGGIVYTGTRPSVENIVAHLRRHKISAAGYHAGLKEGERNSIQEAFLEGKINIIVATNAFGMGIDRPDIRGVIHHQLPGSVEAYYQECGRAGRDAEPAFCLLLYYPPDRRLQEFFIEASYPPPEVILEVYQVLKKRPEDPIWLTYRQIGSQIKPAVSEMAISSALRILEENGLVHRLYRHENLAELYLKVNPESLLSSLPKKSTSKIEFLKNLCQLYSPAELLEGIKFIPEELLNKTHLSPEKFRRIMAELAKKGEVSYIPPFRGRGLRLLKRVPLEDLNIDFQRLSLRKAHEIDKLQQVIAYAQLNRCRRAFLLEYFGEYYPPNNCAKCDICLNRKTARPAPENSDPLPALKILSGVARLRGRFGRELIGQILSGEKGINITKFQLHLLSPYGLLVPFPQEQVQKWIQELITLGYLKQELKSPGGRDNPVLILTSRGQEALKKKEVICLSPPLTSRGDGDKEKLDGKQTLFAALQELRRNLARQEGLPPYCIFPDGTLRQLAAKRPTTPQEMMTIGGVGEVTFKKYGRLFLDLIISFANKQKSLKAEEENPC